MDAEISILMQRATAAAMSLEEIIAEEIKEFKATDKYQLFLQAEQYYLNKSDVQNKTNDFKSRSNSKIEHPILKKLIDQKVNYLLTREFSVKTEDTGYGEALNSVFDNSFRKKLKSFCRGAIKSGIGWLQPYFGVASGEVEAKLKFMRIPAHEVIPLWLDNEHTELDGFIRFFDQIVYEGKDKKTYIKAEYWDTQGVKYYVSTDSGKKFLPDNDRNIEDNHFAVGDTAYNWQQPPIIWLKYNEDELPLFYFLQSLIDDYNWQTSVTADVLRDIAKFIYVLKNYGGVNLDEFLKDLRESLAIKVNDDGGVDKLTADLNIDAVMQFLDKQRRDLYDYAAGVDTKDKDLGNASGTAINFRYMDLDNDCSNLSSELKDSFLQLKPFLDSYFSATGQGDYTAVDFDVTFNADMPVNESDVINNVKNSNGIISKRTQLDNHPWVTDVDGELDEIKKEQTEAMAEFGKGVFDADLQTGGNVNDEQQGILGKESVAAGT